MQKMAAPDRQEPKVEIQHKLEISNCIVSTGCLLWTKIAKVPWDPRDRGISGRHSVACERPKIAKVFTMLQIWTQGLLFWTQDLNLGIWEKPWVGIQCARNRLTTQDRQGTIKYLDTLAMRKNRQVSCEADKRQDLHGTLARGGVNRGIPNDCRHVDSQILKGTEGAHWAPFRGLSEA